MFQDSLPLTVVFPCPQHLRGEAGNDREQKNKYMSAFGLLCCGLSSRHSPRAANLGRDSVSLRLSDTGKLERIVSVQKATCTQRGLPTQIEGAYFPLYSLRCGHQAEHTAAPRPHRTGGQEPVPTFATQPDFAHQPRFSMCAGILQAPVDVKFASARADTLSLAYSCAVNSTNSDGKDLVTEQSAELRFDGVICPDVVTGRARSSS